MKAGARLAALVVGSACGGGVSEPVTVFAAASLTEAFTDLAGVYRELHPGRSIRFNFAGSHQLAFQLAHGARADVFAAADRRWVERVDSLWVGEPVYFAHNRLVVIVPVSHAARLSTLSDLATPGIRLVIADAAVPVGGYTRAALARLERGPGFPAGFAQRVLANVVSQEDNVKSVVAKVRLSEADAGVVYRSDVTPALVPYVRVLEFPDWANPPARYPVVAVPDADHNPRARSFVALLVSPPGREVLERHGFEVP